MFHGVIQKITLALLRHGVHMPTSYSPTKRTLHAVPYTTSVSQPIRTTLT